ncbi:hypothetical protein F5X96DRAFT_502074 [Biscogniauxia mediterranea]|nr:hypothetical protein F5X96DRAFT_502074 [Biscogniauxia mediterranea]
MPSQKAIISTALAKASTAVQLDNSQYYSGARKYYVEACELLDQVITRVNNGPDRQKLERVRIAYIHRIRQLDDALGEPSEEA